MMWTPISEQNVVSSTGDGSVKFKIKCPNSECGKDVFSDCIPITAPNTMGDNEEQSTVYQDELITCDYCGEEFELSISNGNGGMYAEVMGLRDSDISYSACTDEAKSSESPL